MVLRGGRGVTVDVDDVHQQARGVSGLEDVGRETRREGLGLRCESRGAEAQLSDLARVAVPATAASPTGSASSTGCTVTLTSPASLCIDS